MVTLVAQCLSNRDMKDEKNGSEIQRLLDYGIWETLPILDCMKEIKDEDGRASIYLLEAVLADDTDYSQDEVRSLLRHAIHDGYLEQRGEWVTLAPEYQYNSIAPWDDE